MFVVDALARNFALELRKRQQHVEGKTTHAGGGVESSRHRDKRDVKFIEEFDQLGEVGKRPCQTIDLVDDDDIDLSSANVVQQLLPSGARLWNRRLRGGLLRLASSDAPGCRASVMLGFRPTKVA
jgi:hypothetical protein